MTGNGQPGVQGSSICEVECNAFIKSQHMGVAYFSLAPSLIIRELIGLTDKITGPEFQIIRQGD